MSEIEKISKQVMTLITDKKTDLSLIKKAVDALKDVIEPKLNERRSMCLQGHLMFLARELKNYCSTSLKGDPKLNRTQERLWRMQVEFFKQQLEKIALIKTELDADRILQQVLEEETTSTSYYDVFIREKKFGESENEQKFAILHLAECYLRGEHVTDVNTPKVAELLKRLIEHNEIILSESPTLIHFFYSSVPIKWCEIRMHSLIEKLLGLFYDQKLDNSTGIALITHIFLNFEPDRRAKLMASVFKKLETSKRDNGPRSAFATPLSKCCMCNEPELKAIVSPKETGKTPEAELSAQTIEQKSELTPQPKKRRSKKKKKKAFPKKEGSSGSGDDSAGDSPVDDGNVVAEDMGKGILVMAPGIVMNGKADAKSFDESKAEKEQEQQKIKALQEENRELQQELAKSKVVVEEAAKHAKAMQERDTKSADNLSQSKRVQASMQLKNERRGKEIDILRKEIDRQTSEYTRLSEASSQVKECSERRQDRMEKAIAERNGAKAENEKLKRQLKEVRANAVTSNVLMLQAQGQVGMAERRANTAERKLLEQEQQAQERQETKALLGHARDKLDWACKGVAKFMDDSEARQRAREEKSGSSKLSRKIYPVGTYNPFLRLAQYCLQEGDIERASRIVKRLLLVADMDFQVEYEDDGPSFHHLLEAKMGVDRCELEMDGWDYVPGQGAAWLNDASKENGSSYVQIPWKKTTQRGKKEEEKFEVDVTIRGPRYEFKQFNPISSAAKERSGEHGGWASLFVTKTDGQQVNCQIDSFPLEREEVFKLSDKPVKQLELVRKHLSHVLKLVATDSITNKGIEGVFRDLQELKTQFDTYYTGKQKSHEIERVSKLYQSAVNFINGKLTRDLARDPVTLCDLVDLCEAIGERIDAICLTLTPDERTSLIREKQEVVTRYAP